MWHLTVKNDYCAALTVLGHLVAPGASYEHPESLGSGIMTIPGHTELNLLDIGDRQLGGPSKATWGVLISFHGEEVVFRYEGEGQLQVRVTELAQIELHTNGALCQVQLPSFKFV